MKKKSKKSKKFNIDRFNIIGLGCIISLLLLITYLVYTSYDEKRPHYKVGECYELDGKDQEKWEVLVYSAKILEIGKKHYHYVDFANNKEFGFTNEKNFSTFEYEYDKKVDCPK